MQYFWRHFFAVRVTCYLAMNMHLMATINSASGLYTLLFGYTLSELVFPLFKELTDNHTTRKAPAPENTQILCNSANIAMGHHHARICA